MEKLPLISGREAVKAFARAGYAIRRQTGSHIILRKDNPFSQIVVPDHKMLDRGTLRSLIRSAGLSVEEFVGLL